ncbi:MAG: SpoIID/LytB domain-containing protein [Candidatus Ozemobacteraceae bacterium]
MFINRLRHLNKNKKPFFFSRNKNARFFLFLAFFSIMFFSVAPANALPEQIRIGLLRFGFPSAFTIEPSHALIEIFDPLKNDTIYSGPVRCLTVQSLDGMLHLLFDGVERHVSDHTLLFSSIGPSPRYLMLGASPRNRRAYRGSLGIVPGMGRLLAITVVGGDEYLHSVVPSEIGTQAPQAALEAQAIAARSYALRNLGRHEAAGFDLCDGQHCQAYGGIQNEFAAGNAAVSRTAGQVLFYDGKPANTVYHAHCGGRLSACNEVWGGLKVPYLPNHPDRLGATPAFCAWNDRKSKVSLPLSFSVSSKTRPSGKAKTGKTPKESGQILFLRGNGPPISLPGPTTVRGHRVGLCQDGAIGMGRAGYDTASILGFYYPGTTLMCFPIPDGPDSGNGYRVTLQEPSAVVAGATVSRAISRANSSKISRATSRTASTAFSVSAQPPGSVKNSSAAPKFPVPAFTTPATASSSVSKGHPVETKMNAAKVVSSESSHGKLLSDFRKWLWKNNPPSLSLKLAAGDHFKSIKEKSIEKGLEKTRDKAHGKSPEKKTVKSLTKSREKEPQKTSDKTSGKTTKKSLKKPMKRAQP